jgi:uncharacterized repeat protein (TIGR01451 family)
VVAYCEGNRDDFDKDEDYDSYDCGCVPNVDLEKDLSTRTAIIGESDKIQVTLTITNEGNTLLDSVSVTDQIDEGTYFDDTQSIGGTCGASVASFVGGLITFDPFSLGAGEKCTIVYIVQCLTPGTHPDTARVVAYCEGNREDYDKDEDFDSYDCDCIPDVELDKTLSTREVLPSGEVEVTLTVRNAGQSVLDSIVVCDKIDAGTSFDTNQPIGGTCDVDLAGTTLNPDNSTTICFDPFSLNPGETCTIIFRVACEEAGEHPDTATVIAYCEGNRETPDRDQDYDSYNCTGFGSCPRTVGFWGQQCAQKLNGSTKYTKAEVIKIAEAVDAKSAYFNWGSGTAAFNGFCAIINPERPMGQPKQLKRQFAALLANWAAGDLDLIANNGNVINLDLSTPISCDGVNAKTIAELIKEIDDILINQRSGSYGSASECADGINNGYDIPRGECSRKAELDRRGVRGGRTDLNTDSGNDDVEPGEELQVSRLELYKPTPNPFNSTTRIAYTVNGQNERVDIGIYNVAGRLVRKLVSGIESPQKPERQRPRSEMERGRFPIPGTVLAGATSRESGGSRWGILPWPEA